MDKRTLHQEIMKMLNDKPSAEDRVASRKWRGEMDKLQKEMNQSRW